MPYPGGPLFDDFDVSGFQLEHLYQGQGQALQVRGGHQQVIYVRSCV